MSYISSYHGFQNRTLWEGMSPFSKLVSESGGNVQIGSLPNMERFHLGTAGSSTAGSLEAQLRAGKSTYTGMPLSDHLTKNEMTQLQKSGCQLHFGSLGQPVAMIRFAGSPAVAGLEGDMSDDTVVASELWSLIQILISKSQLFTQALCCDSSSNVANTMWWQNHMKHCF